MNKVFVMVLFLFSVHLNAQNLKDFKWQNRLVILFGENSPKALEHQKKALLEHQKELEERDVIIFEGNAILQNQLKVDSSFQGLVLIGKDGGIKLQKPFQVVIEELYVLIDGMPMRKSEIRRKNKS